MKGVRSLAAAQTVPARGDVDANLEAHLRLVQAAAEEKARILVFPELSLTGYELDLAQDLAFTEEDPRLAPLLALADSYGMTLVVGAPLRLGEHLHIGAFLIGPGHSLEIYTKHHLGAFPADTNPGGAVPPAENTVFHPGARNPLIGFGGHLAAVGVCADTGRPSHPESAAARGADCYLASMFFTPAELEAEGTRLASYARKHSMAVVLSNFGGPTGGLPSAGGSAIWSEKGECLAQLDGTGSGIVVAIEEPAGWNAKAVRI